MDNEHIYAYVMVILKHQILQRVYQYLPFEK